MLGLNFYARRHLADNSIGDAPSKAPDFAPSMSSGDDVKLPQSPISLLEKHKDYVRLVLIVVLPTAAFSFIAAFLIFYCCGCNKNKVSVGEQRDDHPLLHMQLANVPGETVSLCQPVMASWVVLTSLV